MTLKKLVFKAGINKENTQYSTEGGWYEGDKVRFRQGTPEKIGGWGAISSSTFLGVCRSLWNWVTLAGQNLIAVGTNLKYYIQFAGSYYDVTPLKYSTSTATLTNPFSTTNNSTTVTVTDTGRNLSTGDLVTFSGVSAAVNGIPAANFNSVQFSVTRVNTNSYTITTASVATSTGSSAGGSVTASYVVYTTILTNPFATVNGSPTVTVTDASNGCVTGDFVDFTSSTTVNGVTISGTYAVTVVTSNTYTIQASTNATATGSGVGGTVTVQHEIDIGQAIQTPNLGWGAGGWGLGTWGNGQSIPVQLRIWSQSNFGENLVYGPRGGGMYYWTAASGLTVRGIAVQNLPGASDVPTIQNNILVSDVSRFTIAFGCNNYEETTLDPMLIRWADQESVTDWTPTAANQAGSLRLSRGSTIVTAVQNRQEIDVLTDAALYSFQYLGPPAVWGATLVASNTSIIGPNAAVLAANVLFWMGIDKFYTYNGTVTTLRCDLRKYIFDDINQSQGYQVCAGTIESFNEIWWFYCSAQSTVIDRYVIYNYIEDAWSYGSLGRTAWIDVGLLNYPVAATYSQNLVYHEFGVDDATTSTVAPIASYIASSEFDIEDGDHFSFVKRLLPDVSFEGSTAANPSLVMTLIPLQNSGSGYNSPQSTGGIDYATVTRTATVPIEQFTGQVFIRVRGRQLVLRVDSSQLGVQWQLGAPRIDLQADGRRGNS